LRYAWLLFLGVIADEANLRLLEVLSLGKKKLSPMLRFCMSSVLA